MARGGYRGKKWGLVASGCEGQKTSRNTGSVDSSRVRLEDLLSCGDQSSSAAHVWSRAEFALSVDPAGLVKKASEVLDSDVEIIFASATEQESVDRGRKPKTSKHRKDSSTSSSSSDMEEDDPFGVLRKTWLGEDIGGGEQKRHSSAAASGKSRFPLLDRREKEITKNSDELDLGKVLSHLKGGKDPVRSLLALHLVESLKGKLKKGRSSHSRDKSISASSSSSGDQDSSGSEHHRRRGHARAVETYQNSKRRMFRKPLKYTKKYVKEVERDLGAENRPYHLSEIGKKIAWGKQKSLQRCHYMLSDILTKLLKGPPDRKSNAPNSVVPSVGSSSSPGRRLEHCLASDTSSGSLDSQAVGRGSGRFGKCDRIPEEHGRSQQECRQDPSIQRCSGKRNRRVSAWWKSPRQEGQRERQRQEGEGQSRVISRLRKASWPCEARI